MGKKRKKKCICSGILKIIMRISESYFLLFLFLFLSLVTIIFLVLNGNYCQPFNDVVVEFTSKIESNKSIEMQLVYLLSIGGIGLVLLYNFINKNM